VVECQLPSGILSFNNLEPLVATQVSVRRRRLEVDLASQTQPTTPACKLVSRILRLSLYWPREVPLMARVNIALPHGLYLLAWYAGGKRRRESAGVTAAQALEAQRRKKHQIEGRELGLPGFEQAGETVKKPPLHVAVKKYLERIKR